MVLRRSAVGSLWRRCGGACRSSARRTNAVVTGQQQLASTSRRSASSAAIDNARSKDKEKEGEGEPLLVRLDSARLAFPPYKSDDNISTTSPPPISLSIYPPSTSGGHAVLGRNGSGKSLLHLALSHGTSVGGPEHNHLVDGTLLHSPDSDENDVNQKLKSRYPVSSVSFDSHHTLLQQDISAYAALTPLGGRLTKAAEFLVVRFGLYPLLNRQVTTLSTGEIRKILLVRALSTRPQLLLLDNAFDGLDVPSRIKLSDLVSNMLRGFRQDILVQGVSASNAARTQVVMSTHRSEELVDEIGVVSWLGRSGDSDIGDGEGRMVTERRMGRSGTRLMRAVHDGFAISTAIGAGNSGGGDWSPSSSIGDEEEAEQEVAKKLWHHSSKSKTSHQAADRATWGNAIQGAWDDPDLPTIDDIAALMNSKKRKGKRRGMSTRIVQAKNLRIFRDEYMLLSDLSWTVINGERWLIAGGNGAGKSMLSKLLTRQQGNHNNSSSSTDGSDSGVEGSLSISFDQDDIGWVSTELHMRLARSDCMTRDVLLGIDTYHDGSTNTAAEATPVDVGEAVASWLNIDPELLSRPFSNLSQGEQKMILIARAIASRPRLLIVDEPMQGLDWHNRRRVLGLVERLCRATDMSLVYITHHLEELLPSVSKVLHLREGRVVYNGDIDEYDPEEV